MNRRRRCLAACHASSSCGDMAAARSSPSLSKGTRPLICRCLKHGSVRSSAGSWRLDRCRLHVACRWAETRSDTSCCMQLSCGGNWQGSRQLQQQLWKFGTCPEHDILLVDGIQPNKAQLPQQWQRADQRLQLAPRHQQVAWPPAGACVCGGIHV